jgi:hypothetical protein
VLHSPGGIPDDVEDTLQKKNFYKEQATAYYRKLGMDAHKYVNLPHLCVLMVCERATPPTDSYVPFQCA